MSEPLFDGVLWAPVQAHAPWSGSALVHGFGAKVHGFDVTVPGDTHWFFVTARLQYQVLCPGPGPQLPDVVFPATSYVTVQHGFVAVRPARVPARPGAYLDTAKRHLLCAVIENLPAVIPSREK